MALNSITGNTMLISGSFPPVRAASTGAPLHPVTGGLLVVDGVQLAAGDRVLAKDEASAVNNGIYAASTGPWTRTTDATGNTQFFSGMAVTVALGAVNAGQTFICTCQDDPVVVSTSLITFASQQVVATATQQATSTTSLTIGTGSKTLTISAGKALPGRAMGVDDPGPVTFPEPTGGW
jgi:phage-related tail fiber protein